MKLNTIFGGGGDRRALRQRLEGYTASAIFHILLLLLLGSITLSSGSEGFGFGVGPKAARVSIVARENTVDDAELEQMAEDVSLKPIEVERIEQRPVSMPELKSFSAPRPDSRRLANIQTRFAPVSGGVGGLSGQFGSFIGGLRKTGLDVAIVIDATASMQHVIDEIKSQAGALVSGIQRLVPIARVGAVAFRDSGDEFVVKWRDLSFHKAKVQAWLDDLQADGGGDYEEAVRQGLEAAIDELSWRRRAKRVIIIVGSSPPHKSDIPAIEALAREFAESGGVISAIDVTKRMHEEYQRNLHIWLHGTEPDEISPMPEFYNEVRASYRSMAENGNGELASLGSDAQLVQQILYFAFGSRWEKEVARYAGEG